MLDVWQHDIDANATSMPTPLRCSYERLQDNGVYLIGKPAPTVIFSFIMLGVFNSYRNNAVGFLFSRAVLYRKQRSPRCGTCFGRSAVFTFCAHKVIFDERNLEKEKLQLWSHIKKCMTAIQF